MASEKVAGVLSTKIKLDTTEASKSMRQLNNDINSTVSILKQQEQEFKSTGDNVNALQTKISRLTETQNGYYEKLKLLKQGFVITFVVQNKIVLILLNLNHNTVKTFELY